MHLIDHTVSPPGNRDRMVGMASRYRSERRQRSLASHRRVALGVSRNWGDEDGSDMTGRAVAGWGIVDEVGFATGRNGDRWPRSGCRRDGDQAATRPW